jgi:hypothetical protein
MKRSIILILLCICLYSPARCDERPLLQWEPYAGISGLYSLNGSLSFTSTNNFPLLVSQDNLFVGANQYRYLAIKISSDKGFLSGRLFFMRIGDKDFSMGNAYEFLTGAGGSDREYLIDLWKSPSWFGTISRLMINPGNAEGSFRVSGIRFLEPSLFLSLRSYWQEFFAFEVPQMRTVNFIYGPRLNGISVNIYIYWAILLAAMIIFAFYFVVKKDVAKIFIPSSKAILVFCIVCWMALDARHALDQARTVQMDSPIFLGKTLEERRAAVTLGDYYPFLAFCGANIPAGSKFELIAPTYYYFGEKAIYYLYPIRAIVKDEKADYIIVYDPGKQPDLQQAAKERIAKGYKPYKIFKEGQYILKK